jgi:acetylornithine deacetylase
VAITPRRTEGVSAIEKFILLFAALHRLEARRNANPGCVGRRWPLAYRCPSGTIHAGDWASSVPDLLVAEGRLGVAPDELMEAARAISSRRWRSMPPRPWLRTTPPASSGGAVSSPAGASRRQRPLGRGAPLAVGGGPQESYTARTAATCA